MELKYPSLQLSLALAFWGWQSDMLVYAAAILLLVVISHRTPWRWEMEKAEFHRIGDLTAVLLGFAIIYFYSSDSDTLAVYSILRWLPMLSLPLLLGQLYSMGQLLPLSALFYSMRRYGIATTVDIRLPYAFLCILAAGSGNATDQSYFIGVTAFTLLVLWTNRSGRHTGVIWFLSFLLAGCLGYGIQTGLVKLQEGFEEWAVDWFADWEPDPFKTRTAIGDRGKLKLSSRVILQVSPDDFPLKYPLLLKEAAYDRYSGQYWTAGNSTFQTVTQLLQANTEPLIPTETALNHITVLHLLAQHSVLLALPNGMHSLQGPPEENLLRNKLGTIKWLETPPVVRYRIAYVASDKDASAPTPFDTQLIPSTAKMLEPLKQELGLSRLTPEQAVASIAIFFATRFAYTLDLGNSRDEKEALADFLYRRHAGHCEYFATATALLLRVAGVPARYVVGYSVQEPDSDGKTYRVRQRHAHAWIEAYVNGAWQTLDNTPSRWAEEEAKADPWWQAMTDLWSDWAIHFKVWQWERAKQDNKEAIPWWGWLVIPLSAWLGWRLYQSRKRVASLQGLQHDDNSADQFEDPEYARLVEQLLAEGHPPRNLGETPLQWLRRLGLNAHEEQVLGYYRRRYRGNAVDTLIPHALAQEK